MREGQDTVRETETAGEGVPETGAVPPEDGPDAWGPRYGAEASWDEGSGIWVVRVPGLDVQVEGESREAALLLAEEAVEARLAEMPETVPDGAGPGDGTEGPSDSGEPSGTDTSPGTGGPSGEETEIAPDDGEPSGKETDEGSDGGEASGTEAVPDPYGGETLFSPRIAALVLGVVAVIAGILRWLDIG